MASRTLPPADRPSVWLQQPANLALTSILRIGYLYALVWGTFRPAVGVLLSNHSWWQRGPFIVLVLLVYALIAGVALLSVSSWAGEWTRRRDVTAHLFKISHVPASPGFVPQGTIVWAPPFVLQARVIFGRTLAQSPGVANDSLAGLLPEFNHVFLDYPPGGLDERLAFQQLAHVLGELGFTKDIIWFGLSQGQEVLARLAAHNDSLGSYGFTSVRGFVSWSGPGGFWGLRWFLQVGLLVFLAFSDGPLWDAAWDWSNAKGGQGLWKLVKQSKPDRQHLIDTNRQDLIRVANNGVRSYRAILSNMQSLTRTGLIGARRPNVAPSYPVVAVNLPPGRDAVLRVRRAKRNLNRIFGSQPSEPTVRFVEYAIGDHAALLEFAQGCAEVFRKDVLPKLNPVSA